MTFRPDRIVHRIAMIYREVETCGGIQRGASFQANQFRGWGIEPVILSEADLGAAETAAELARLRSDSARLAEVRRILKGART